LSNIGELWNFLTNAKIVMPVSSKPVILAGPVQTGRQGEADGSTVPRSSGRFRREVPDCRQSAICGAPAIQTGNGRRRSPPKFESFDPFNHKRIG